MKVLILAGGYGTRISEETGIRPKPMVEIGGMPILWHVMKVYSHYGFNDFVILCGYKGHAIKEFFFNYHLHRSSMTFDLATNTHETISTNVEKWKVTCLDTGIDTMTGGRIKKAQKLVGKNPFLLTYGDGVADVNISDLIKNHKKSGSKLTLTAVQPAGRFGALEFNDNGLITAFKEKPKGEIGWINGGFCVCEPEVFDFIDDNDQTTFERGPMEQLAAQGQMNSYKHTGFWKCMDTLADKNTLDNLWDKGEAKWKVW